jgi:hypothetical protein
MDDAPKLIGGIMATLSACSKVYQKSPLSGVKRTCHFALHMSAFDPKRT